MKTSIFNLSFLFLLSTILFSCSAEDDGIYFNENKEVVNTASVSYSDIEYEILDLVNAHRADLGLTTLVNLNVISVEADVHTDYMIKTNSVNHDNFNKRAENLMTNAGAKIVGENVAYGFSSAQGVFNGWLKSDEHRKIIENPSYTHFGISTNTNSQNRNYFTQIFIEK
ncbi:MULTISPECIES: CAP domain-containing protein [Flavobacteriaceae]|uniref:CAP domain-containing protein n=2 Tax=Flavobacteriaceae TaxID=49546 RepID=A0A4Y8AVS4_9FLAO|nr:MULTISPECIES: CAP domain-containing protein [Flavobacteriaceae]TEW76627.1 CAP domain-containing protein [Gramella jeungdoensis]GGK51413.1 hypothetical protein GCM10007963_19700 [Lutibacter litoralis]